MKPKKLVRGVGINNADYAVQRFETIGCVGGKRKRKKVWVCPYYRAWENMLSRCYSAKYQERQPAYIGCTVSEEWLTFSNFKAWMEKQEWEGKQLSKDLLFEGNKVYSAENCVFVTRAVNNPTTDSKASRGEWFNVGATLSQNTGDKTMNNLILSDTENLTMTSLEIAELVGSRHDKVKQSIERLANRKDSDGNPAPVIQLPPMGEVKNHLGQSVSEYIFTGEKGKRDSIVVVARLSPEFTAKLVDRWQELESAGSPANLTPSELLLMHAQRLVDMEREQAQMKAQVTALVEGENFMTVVGYCNLTGRRIDQKETARIGKLATALCKANGWDTGTAPHPVFGYVNSYPFEVLAVVFGD